MKKRVIVWGTGNVGRPAIRAVLSHHDLELAGVVVANPAKLGRDAGEIAGVAKTGVLATDDARGAARAGRRCGRVHRQRRHPPAEALGDLLACLRAGANVVSTSFYPLLYPPSTAARAAGAAGRGRLPRRRQLAVRLRHRSGLGARHPAAAAQRRGLRHPRGAQPGDLQLRALRPAGRGAQGDRLRRARWIDCRSMLHDFALKMVWEPMVRLLGDGLGRPVDAVETCVERRPLARTIEVAGMGQLRRRHAGGVPLRGARPQRGQGALRRRARHAHRRRLRARLALSARGTRLSSRADQRHAGSCTSRSTARMPTSPAPPAAATPPPRIASSTRIPAVCDAAPGVLTPLDLPPITGAAQWRRMPS